MRPSAASTPPSPGTSPVHLSDCIEELVRFTLSSSLDGADLGLSRDYCARLHQDEGPLEDPIPTRLQAQDDASDACGGVPVHPLYKRLALAIQRCINRGSFLKTSKSVEGIEEVESLMGRENEWSELIAEKGSELLSMYEAVEFELHVQEPFFSHQFWPALIEAYRRGSQLVMLQHVFTNGHSFAGLKTVEGRCALGNYNRIGRGVLLIFNKCLLFQVQHVKRYTSFLEMLEAETLTNVLPGVKTIEEGVRIYRNFYTEEREKSNGVLAISLSRLDSQPYISMSALLSGLSYDGVGSLLGIMHTVGTIPDALPPPRSALLSSFMLPYRPDVEGSFLSNGARALAKHVSRSSNGWWGSFVGSDANKNELALEVINRLLTCCCWMNIHSIQPYEHVFEIRIGEGYGARWSRDGSKFIGFLEPHMEEGHAKGWRH